MAENTRSLTRVLLRFRRSVDYAVGQPTLPRAGRSAAPLR